MKKRNNRFLAGTLAGLMMLTMLPVTALAAQGGADDDAASDTPNNNIVNVVSDGKNVQQAENNDVNVEANGGNENAQKSADDSSGDTENVQESADDSIDDTENVQKSADDSSGELAPPPTPAVGSFVAKIGTQTYETLEEAISVAQNGETIEVGQDITIEEGGLAFVEKDALTIKGVGDSKPTITMKDLGMSLSKTKVTFENIKIVEESVTNNPADSGGTANLVSNSDFTLKNASLELNGPADQTSGSGMYLYQKSNLYVKDGSTVAVSGYNGQRASGIYADNSEYDNMPNRNIQVTGNSSITITDCDWHGMTVNPIDILIDDNSKIDISQCGNASYGGGLGCYYGSVTISNHSKLITDDNNGSGWGVFANGLKVDATSSLSACNNKGCGAALASKSKIESGATVTLNENEKDGLRVYTGSNYWYGDVTIEEGANFTACENKDNGIEILPEGILDMQDGTVTHNHSGTYGGGLYNRGGTAKIGGKAVIYNNHADTAGDDIYSETEPSVSLSQVNNGWMLDDCKEKYQKEHPIVGWYHDGKEKLTDNAYKRWNGDGEGDAYYADEYTVGKEAVSDALALKAAHGQFCSVTYEVTGDVPSDASALPAAAKVKMNGNYTVAPVQTTSQSRYTFSGWRINGVGDVVTEIKDIQQDVKLIGVWTRRSSGGGGSSRPTVDIPDDVPTGLNGDDHYAYIVGYPDSTVRPQNGITRAEVATIFFRLLTDETRNANSTKSNSYSDVAAGAWYNHAVSTLSAMGIVKGDSQGKFNPNAPITRAEFAAIAARFDDKANTTAVDFSDIASHWAKNEISAAANNGWINGYTDGTFRPNNKITRAEAMTLVNRVLKRLPETVEDLHNDMIKWSDNSDTSAWYYLAVQEATNSHYYDLKENKHEKWSKLRETRDWTELEK